MDDGSRPRQVDPVDRSIMTPASSAEAAFLHGSAPRHPRLASTTDEGLVLVRKLACPPSKPPAPPRVDHPSPTGYPWRCLEPWQVHGDAEADSGRTRPGFRSRSGLEHSTATRENHAGTRWLGSNRGDDSRASMHSPLGGLDQDTAIPERVRSAADLTDNVPDWTDWRPMVGVQSPLSIGSEESP